MNVDRGIFFFPILVWKKKRKRRASLRRKTRARHKVAGYIGFVRRILQQEGGREDEGEGEVGQRSWQKFKFDLRNTGGNVSRLPWREKSQQVIPPLAMGTREKLSGFTEGKTRRLSLFSPLHYGWFKISTHPVNKLLSTGTRKARKERERERDDAQLAKKKKMTKHFIHFSQI